MKRTGAIGWSVALAAALVGVTLGTLLLVSVLNLDRKQEPVYYEEWASFPSYPSDRLGEKEMALILAFKDLGACSVDEDCTYIKSPYWPLGCFAAVNRAHLSLAKQLIEENGTSKRGYQRFQCRGWMIGTRCDANQCVAESVDSKVAGDRKYR
ncbi:MAG: hypothetical protein AAGH19_12610 [Pseudomonadota bacterium]